MKRKNNGSSAVTLMKRYFFILGVLFAFLLTGCATEEHKHNYDYSVKGEPHTIKTTELAAVASGGIPEVYVTLYQKDGDLFTSSENYYLAYDKSLEEIKLANYYDWVSKEYITEGTAYLEEYRVVLAYCPECGDYMYGQGFDDGTRHKFYIPEGTFAVVLE